MHNDFAERLTPDYMVGGVLAFRTFQIDSATQALTGLTYRQEIAPEVNVAQCAVIGDDEEHRSPQEGCSCGWYAYDERRRWIGGGMPARPVHPSPLTATGIVRLSGKIIVCERGLKAEYMEVVALTVHSSDEVLIRQLFPDVEVFEEERLMLKAYPLIRLSRDDGSEEGADSQNAFRVLGLNVTPALSVLKRGADRIKDVWGSLTANIARQGVLGVLSRVMVLGFWVACLLFLREVSREVFPLGSLNGFGPLVPFGLLVLLSPLLNIWRSKGGIIVYLFLLTHGIVGSEDALASLTEQVGADTYQAVIVVLALYLVPLTLLFILFMEASGLFRLSSPPPSSSGVAMAIGARGAPKGSMAMMGSGRGKTASPTAPLRGGAPNNHLPKKVKSSIPEGGDSTPGTTGEGGHHG